MDNTERQTLNAQLAERGLELGEPVSQGREIAAISKHVWSIISQAGGLTNYHPFVKANPVDHWPGVGARDSVVYYSGLVYQRDFVGWFEGVGYDLELGPKPPAKTARVRWRIEDLSATDSALTIEVIPYLQADLPEARKKAYQRKVFGNTIATYLDSVVRGVEAYAISGTVVQKDQFGSHPLYSSAD